MKIGRNDPCLCGSGNKYKKCCYGKSGEPIDVSDELSVKKYMGKCINEAKISQCIHPEKEKCSEQIVKAHSIQNNKILASIAKSGKIFMFKPESTMNFVKLSPKEIGRKVATTFSGFCGYHDKSTFQPIEDRNYDASEEQNFLFAYRAFAFECHKKAEAFNVIKGCIKQRPELQKDRGFLDIYKGNELAMKDFGEYEKIFDIGLLRKDYSVIGTMILEVPNRIQIAVCSGFAIEYDVLGNQLNDLRSIYSDRMKPIWINVFPQDQQGYVLISWFKEDEQFLKGFLQQFGGSTYEEKINILNNLIPSYCENFVMNPDFWSCLPAEEKRELKLVFKDGLSVLCLPGKRYLKTKRKYDLFKTLVN